MDIAIAGLGLIGGSLAKAITANTDHVVSGFDISKKAVQSALKDGSIDFVTDNFSDFDIVLVSLYPKETVDFLRNHINEFSENTIVVDCCGVKEYICENAKEIFKDSPAMFLGGHPMAGREQYGYDNSVTSLFDNASMILTPDKEFPKDALEKVKDFILSVGFASVKLSTPEHHDKVIAYTSQLAHVVSSAYMLSPAAEEFMGFSAGSFADLTRVARLHPEMWSELFLKNSDCLSHEIDILIDILQQYKTTIAKHEKEKLVDMLQKGSDIKERLTKQRQEEKA